MKYEEEVNSTTPADLRAAIARCGLPKYIVGARCGVHPVRLSRLLHGREPLTDELTRRILAVTCAARSEREA